MLLGASAPADFDALFAVNVHGAASACREALRRMPLTHIRRNKPTFIQSAAPTDARDRSPLRQRAGAA